MKISKSKLQIIEVIILIIICKVETQKYESIVSHTPIICLNVNCTTFYFYINPDNDRTPSFGRVDSGVEIWHQDYDEAKVLPSGLLYDGDFNNLYAFFQKFYGVDVEIFSMAAKLDASTGLVYGFFPTQIFFDATSLLTGWSKDTLESLSLNIDSAFNFMTIGGNTIRCDIIAPRFTYHWRLRMSLDLVRVLEAELEGCESEVLVVAPPAPPTYGDVCVNRQLYSVSLIYPDFQFYFGLTLAKYEGDKLIWCISGLGMINSVALLYNENLDILYYYFLNTDGIWQPASTEIRAANGATGSFISSFSIAPSGIEFVHWELDSENSILLDFDYPNNPLDLTTLFLYCPSISLPPPYHWHIKLSWDLKKVISGSVDGCETSIKTYSPSSFITPTPSLLPSPTAQLSITHSTVTTGIFGENRWPIGFGTPPCVDFSIHAVEVNGVTGVSFIMGTLFRESNSLHFPTLAMYDAKIDVDSQWCVTLPISNASPIALMINLQSNQLYYYVTNFLFNEQFHEITQKSSQIGIINGNSGTILENELIIPENQGNLTSWEMFDLQSIILRLDSFSDSLIIGNTTLKCVNSTIVNLTVFRWDVKITSDLKSVISASLEGCTNISIILPSSSPSRSPSPSLPSRSRSPLPERFRSNYFFN